MLKKYIVLLIIILVASLITACSLLPQQSPPVAPGTAASQAQGTTVPVGGGTLQPINTVVPSLSVTRQPAISPTSNLQSTITPTAATNLTPTSLPTLTGVSGLSGIVTNKVTGNPVVSATVYAYSFSQPNALTAPMQVVSATTNISGSFSLQNVPQGATLTIAWPGYLAYRQKLDKQPNLNIALEPHAAKGAYLTYLAAGYKPLLDEVLGVIDRTELNTIIVDVKGDRGFLSYKSNVLMAEKIGANNNPTIDDLDAFIKLMKQKNIYVIARIVTFKDNPLAQSRPELAIKNTRTGTPWIDDEKLAWADPFQKEVWDYNTALAREVILRGFDEVQFDYIRFPTDGQLSVAQYTKENTAANRVAAITGFLDQVRREVKPLGGFISMDVFGYTVYNAGDLEIGQRLEDVSRHLDYISPMVYPSTFNGGIPGTDITDIAGAVTHPYEVVNDSSKHAIKRLAGMPVRVRPWIQDFNDYAYDDRKYGAPEVKAQIKGAVDAGATGWLLWSPGNTYTEEALDK